MGNRELRLAGLGRGIELLCDGLTKAAEVIHNRDAELSFEPWLARNATRATDTMPRTGINSVPIDKTLGFHAGQILALEDEPDFTHVWFSR